MPLRTAQTRRRHGRDRARWDRSTCRVHASPATWPVRPVFRGAQAKPGGEQIHSQTVASKIQDFEPQADVPAYILKPSV